MQLEARAARFAALGEPVRLLIVDHLSLGDAAPGELGALVHLPSNHLAFHLKVLREAGLDPVRDVDSMVVAMLDVDHFKKFNDTHGHAAGDMALKELSHVLRAALRRSDVVARYGGEEILLVLPGTDIDRGMEKLDEVRVQVGLTDIALPRGGTARITVSIGVAGFGIDGRDVNALLDIADRRLYQAKDAGRNRVIGPVVAA